MDYNHIREQFKPHPIKYLLIAESPPPAANTPSSRHFYRTDQIRRGDRLFINTIKALYPTTANLTEAELEKDKVTWLKRFQKDGWYLIEALPNSLPHHITRPERQALIHQNLPNLIKQMAQLAQTDTKIILIKSNVFEIAAQPLRQAGFNILNTRLLDYPGQYNQAAYRQKLSSLLKI